MRDEDWGEFEEAFFRAGEAQSQQAEGVSFDADDMAALGLTMAAAPPRFVSLVQERRRMLGEQSQIWRQRAQLWRQQAQHWALWQGRMFQLRLTVSLFAGAEHALRAVSSYAFHPRRVARRPWLARACIVVLVSSVSSYSAAAVLVASGAL